MNRKYYFFQHRLDATDNVPGRYAFNCDAILANKTCCLGTKRVKVPIDSFEENMPGPNIDPCPFGNKDFPIVHSFCKISDSNNNRVDGNKILSQIVKENDVIFYGHLKYKKISRSNLFV